MTTEDRQSSDLGAMQAAIDAAATARRRATPNPWVGAAVVADDGSIVATGSTEPPGGRHAEIVALDAVRERGLSLEGFTLATTLEPCSHHGRTPPCTEAIIASGVRRVVVGIEDPDSNVAGAGIARLRQAGVDVVVGVLADIVADQLAPYLHHRRSGRPFVVCKLATSLDGGTAAPDGSSKWITGEQARLDVHHLRAESDAILVGAGTVRADDPSLTVRGVPGDDPMRVVLGRAPHDARVHPCLEWEGDLGDLLDELGRRDVVQLLVEGGAAVVRSFHDADLVDRYVVYVAPAFFGGTEARPLLAGPTAATIDALWRGELRSVERIGDDVKIEMDAARIAREA